MNLDPSRVANATEPAERTGRNDRCDFGRRGLGTTCYQIGCERPAEA